MLRPASVVGFGASVRTAIARGSLTANHRLSSSSSSTIIGRSPASFSSSSSVPTTSASERSSSNVSSSSTASMDHVNLNARAHYRPSSHPHPHKRTKLGRTLFALGWIPVAAFITSHLYSLGNVTGGSMSPTFNGPHSIASASSARSDVVLLNRTIKVQLDQLKAGDIVTLISPLDPRLLLTKRVIALPGDTVRVWVPAGKAGGQNVGGRRVGRWARIKIPPGHVWVEGDAAVDIVPGSLERVVNSTFTPESLRNKSRDSREFGPVPMGLITSRIEYIVWPPERFGKPKPRPIASLSSAAQFPPSSSTRMPADDASTQVNPSLARILDEMTSMAPGARTKAHPDDSVISPYVDWSGPEAKEHQDVATAEQARADKEKRKHAWNHLSRGGQLGDDAE